MNSKAYVDVFTDGACPGSGQDGAKAGIGVFFGDNSKLVGPSAHEYARMEDDCRINRADIKAEKQSREARIWQRLEKKEAQDIEAAAGSSLLYGAGIDDSVNVSAPVVGPADSNIAEIQAVTRAAEVARSAGITNLRIHTDSQVVMESAAMLMSDGKTGCSTTEAGKPVANRDALQKMAAAVAPLNVQWNQVRGHGGIHGNEMADKLARKGAEGYTPR